MADRLAGKVALVTGAGSGIGRATAQRFAQVGARVVVNDVNEAGANTTVQAIRELGGEATTVLADVTQAQEVEALIAQTIETYGRLDYAHNAETSSRRGQDILIASNSWHGVLMEA